MTKDIYERMHHQLAWEYSAGLLSFEQMKLEIKKLEDHEHDYKRQASGDEVCFCGAEV